MNNTTPQTQNTTSENISQVSSGPSNLFIYLQHDESFERMALGEAMTRHPDAVAQELDEWERHWNTLGRKDR